MARPTKRSPEVETAILNALRVGNTRTDSALAAGVSLGTLSAWCRRYPEFLADVEKAEADARLRFHEREEASRRLAKSRDVMAWQREMAQLDLEEHAARDPVERGQLPSSEVVAYLRSLPSLWADSGPEGRQALATALFARTDVLGFERMEYELTPDAIELGLGAALPAVFEIGQEREFGRGERHCPATNDLLVMRLAEPPEACEWLRSA